MVVKKRLGDDCFDDDGDCVGHFWGLLETRPYMRVLQALVRLYFEDEQYEKSAYVLSSRSLVLDNASGIE